jgi:hypothetical protein
MKKNLLFNFLLLFAIGFSQNAPIKFETGGQLVGPFPILIMDQVLSRI